MGYEIPQQLQHKEKILFGLTFSQLGWTLFFGTFIFIAFKIGNDSVSRFIFAIVPSVLWICFTFFDLSKWIKSFIVFMSTRKAELNSKSMKKIIEINKIQDSAIHSKNEVAIIEIKPLNFIIKTKEEKETIIYGFQKFLNSLDFPIQFCVTSGRISLEKYFKKLHKKSNNKKLSNDFTNFIKSIIEKKEIKNRFFYLIIPKNSDLEVQYQVCKERLESIGLTAKRLNNHRILEKLFSFFNDEDERKVDEKINNGLHYLIAPNEIKNNVDSFEVNNKHSRIISVLGYPRMVESGFLDKIISSNDDFDISIHIEPFDIETMMILLNKELQKQRADLYGEKKNNSINTSLEIKYKDTLKVLENLQKGNEKLFNLSFYINCKAKSKEELEFLTKKIQSELNSMMMIPNVPMFRQLQGYKSMMPLANDSLNIKRNITTSALSAFFPFTSPFLTLEENGVMLGLNKNKVPYIKDIYSLSNANGVVLATSGSGKSYFTKLLILRQLINNTSVFIIDPQNEYTNLCGHAKGQLITISRHSKTIINPLDLMGHDYIEKRLALMDMFKIMFGELTEIQKSILDRAINETYAKKGITSNSYKGKKMPILGDLYKVLVAMDKKATQLEKMTYRALINRLYMYTDGVFGFMNKQTSINFDNGLVCFNIGDMPKQVKPLVMFLILDFIYMKMKKSKERKLLVIDEAWSMLGKAEEASYVFEIVKTCRKFNLGLLMITQDVADLLNSKAGHAVLANSSYTFLLRQKPAIIDSVVKTFNLSHMEKEYLLTANQGKGIIILDNEHQELEVIASDEEHKIITTNADELNEVVPVEDNSVNVDINLDLDKGLFYGKKLSLDEKNYLLNHGYDVGNFVPIGQFKPVECWVKSNSIESLSHTFLVQNIVQELRKKVKNIEIFITGKPDIVFTIGRKKYAIEIETGNGFKKHKKRLQQKFFNAKLEYKNIIIVLTSSDYKRHYQGLVDLPILVRTDMKEYIGKL